MKKENGAGLAGEFIVRFLQQINPMTLRLMFAAGSAADIREAVCWERKQGI